MSWFELMTHESFRRPGGAGDADRRRVSRPAWAAGETPGERGGRGVVRRGTARVSHPLTRQPAIFGTGFFVFFSGGLGRGADGWPYLLDIQEDLRPHRGVDFSRDLRYPRGRSMSEELFNHPEVRAMIRAILLSKGIRGEEDLKDGIQEVISRCIERVRATGRPPNDSPEARAIARPIAEALGVDELRKRVRRGGPHQGLTPDPDAHARDDGSSIDHVDEKKLAGEAKGAITEKQAERLIGKASGVTVARMAKEDGESEEAVRKDLQRASARARQRLLAIGVGTFAAIVASMMALHVGPFRESDEVTKRPREYAAEQRHFAEGACRAHQWEECKKALDRAAEADPEGEQAPEVKGMREAIAKAKRGAGVGDR
jgi:DNA-directed RNA polymerase specialized sigma24 family protein